MIGQQRFLKLRDGVEVYCDIREVGSPLWLVVTHGIGEHMGRHRYLTDMFGHSMNITKLSPCRTASRPSLSSFHNAAARSVSGPPSIG